LDIGFSNTGDPNPHAGIRNYSGTTVLTLLENGNVGIGTTSPRARLEVAGAIMPAAGSGLGAGILFPPDPFGGGSDQAWMRYYARAGESATLELGISNDADDHIALMPSGNVGIGTITPTKKLEVNGDVKINGTVTSSSDVRLKEDVKDLDSGIALVNRLRPVSFFWSADQAPDRSRGFGLLAQEVEKVLPEVVADDNQGYKSINYNGVAMFVIKAIQELKAELDVCKVRLESMQS
jgi:hypothetical protein